MATRWYYELQGRTQGPISFRELVEMARAGSISGHDIVRSDWDEKWRWAETVPGLFYMARRPLTEPPVIEESGTLGEEKVEEGSGEAPGYDLQEVNGPSGRAWETNRVIGASRIGSIAAAAAEAQEQREAKRTRVPLRDRIAGAFSSTVLEQVLRWGCALAAANLATFALLGWSEAEALRFPEADAANQLPIFPWWGPCSPLEYGLLLGDTMLLFGALGYGLARVLELWVDR